MLARWFLGSSFALACRHAPPEPERAPVDEAPHVRDASTRAELEEAIARAAPGDTIVVHGRIALTEQLHVRASGRPGAWIEIVGDPAGAVLDASGIAIAPPGGPRPWPHDDGAITLRGVHHVAVRGLTIVDAPCAAIAIHDASDVEITRNQTDRSFGSGIAAWDSDHREGGSERVKIVGNVVRRTNDPEVAPPWFGGGHEPPHEAISIGGVVDFEVAFNEVADARKEGIDVKETSRRGRVHHNFVHDAARQCFYVDAWFGPLDAIELDHNLGERCAGAGLAIAVEGKPDAVVSNLDVHDNVLRDNHGSGIFLGLWGADGPRRNLAIHHNTIERNGFGRPDVGRAYFWITGGVFLLSAHVESLELRANRIAGNRGFQIGASDRWLAHGGDLDDAFDRAHVTFVANDVHGEVAAAPIEVGEGARAAMVREWPVAALSTADAQQAGARLDPSDVGPNAWRPTRAQP